MGRGLSDLNLRRLTQASRTWLYCSNVPLSPTSQRSKEVNIRYLECFTFGFRLGKWSFSLIGLLPWSMSYESPNLAPRNWLWLFILDDCLCKNKDYPCEEEGHVFIVAPQGLTKEWFEITDFHFEFSNLWRKTSTVCHFQIPPPRPYTLLCTFMQEQEFHAPELPQGELSLA